ncbi:PH domain-containing protein [Trueperella bialowiezensis]|uniref:Bacterial membrane flanked domain n=1 Tax=Trueperella bialowiezensis TaxID=312285 RepID=A0A3S4VGL9_9ACTO|nr:PH domain-containing protein [Trueperella bialowiezensis]VEI13658.1 Bacterial membrane flanked domain [Trueperella bialowiezensis]
MTSPFAQTVQFTPLHPKFKTVAIIRWGALAAAIIIATFAGAIGGYLGSSNPLWWLLPVAGVLCGIWLVWLALRRARAFGYAELDNELLVRSGIMFHRVSVVPYGRMQQVNVETGPLLKRYGLASVELVTASADTNASIPGVAIEEAERLRDKLTALGEANMEGL